MRAWYNDNSPKVVRWLQDLVDYDAVTPGEVDGRGIQEIRPEDLTGVVRAHFFAGIGGWDYALQLAGWPADRPVWTASLPCQPFSIAGQQKGTEDERHLWPAFRGLVEQCWPPVVFGEQVTSPDGRAWLASVQTDLEALGYAVAAADLCAAGVGAPHIRQRLYWVAYADGAGLEVDGEQSTRQERKTVERGGSDLGMVHPNRSRRQEGGEAPAASRHGASVEPTGGNGRLGNADGSGSRRDGRTISGEETAGHKERKLNGHRPDRSFAAGFRNWDDIVFTPCADGKVRPLKPGVKPLVNGVPGRVVSVHGYGNSIVPQVAAVFVRSAMDVLEIEASEDEHTAC